MSTEHERIWLEPVPGADKDYGRQWCQQPVWADGVEYVRADIALSTPAPVSNLRGLTNAERLEDLRLAAKAIRTYMPETLPAGEDGKIHFARALAEASADAIEAVLATTEGSAE
jgi:hypothetical protein